MSLNLALVYTRAICGINAPLVSVEVHISPGLPKFSIVGLPEAAVKESKDRVRSAIINSLFQFPATRITVNLGPADLPKQGARFDLAIAIALLLATRQLSCSTIHQYELTGELALDGSLRDVSGILPIAIASAQSGRALITSTNNAEEAVLSKQVTAYGAKHLLSVCAHLNGSATLKKQTKKKHVIIQQKYRDLSDVQGQANARRALEIAAAGKHSLLFNGPPGCGKTMLASRLPGILPPLEDADALTVAALYSITQAGFDVQNWGIHAFRTPHHSASTAALVGGGNPPKPGEISLAHKGVLFLDELPEFSRQVLEALREPLEAGSICISRASHQAIFPSDFQLIAAMNPCPCGYAQEKNERCDCTPEKINRYQAKLSGPFLDRIDMHVTLSKLPIDMLFDRKKCAESSQSVRARVIKADRMQIERQEKPNAKLSDADLKIHCALTPKLNKLLISALDKLGLSARAAQRCLKVARTIADLSHNTDIQEADLLEALSYRHVKV